MKIEHREFLADPSVSKGQMKQLQTKISGKAIFSDKLGFKPDKINEKTVVGIDQAFTDEKAISAAVAIKNGEVVEKVHGVSDLEMPYIPGFLAFREAPSIVKALEKLSVEPDLLMLDGSGRIHFRQAGIATHIGVLYNKPSIGVAKNLLCGEPEEDLENRLEEKEKISIKSNEDMAAYHGELVGFAYQSRQYDNPSTYINPLIISPGHRVSADTSVKIVENFCKEHKLPEPTRLADKYVSKIKNKN